METTKIFLKKNWLLILLVGVVLFLAWRQLASDGLYAELMQDYNRQADSFSTQITELQKISEEEINKREEMRDLFYGEIGRIEIQYHASLENIKTQLGKNRAIFVDKAKVNREFVLKSLSDVYGIQEYKGKVQMSCPAQK